MKVIRHQTPSQKLYGIFPTRLQQQICKSAIVTVLVKNLLPAVTSIDQVITAVVDQCSGYSWHADLLPLLTACPLILLLCRLLPALSICPGFSLSFDSLFYRALQDPKSVLWNPYNVVLTIPYRM
jgi:hypothetical protein